MKLLIAASLIAATISSGAIASEARIPLCGAEPDRMHIQIYSPSSVSPKEVDKAPSTGLFEIIFVDFSAPRKMSGDENGAYCDGEIRTIHLISRQQEIRLNEDVKPNRPFFGDTHMYFTGNVYASPGKCNISGFYIEKYRPPSILLDKEVGRYFFEIDPVSLIASSNFCLAATPN